MKDIREYVHKLFFVLKFREEPVGLEILQMTITNLLPLALTRGLLLRKLQENVVELADKHCGRLRWDFHQRFQEIAREFRQTWLAKIDATTTSIRQALERARSQKRTSPQAAQLRFTELDDRLRQILESEASLVALRKNIEEYLH